MLINARQYINNSNGVKLYFPFFGRSPEFLD